MIYIDNDIDQQYAEIEKAMNQTTMLLQFFELNKRDPMVRNILYYDIPRTYIRQNQDKKRPIRKKTLIPLEECTVQVLHKKSFLI